MTRTKPLVVFVFLGVAAAVLASSKVSHEDLPADVLTSDDECAAGGDAKEECSLNALQLRAKTKQAPMESDAVKVDASEISEVSDAAAALVSKSGNETGNETADEVHLKCGDACMQKNLGEVVKEPLVSTARAGPIWHYSLNCWSHCGNKAGMCEGYCGRGNACCRYYSASDPPECHGVRWWPVMSWHTCVHAVQHSRTTTPSPTYSPPDKSSNPYFQTGALSQPSSAPLLEFYMYRVQDDSNYPPENVNTASLPGIMWYLHNEVVYLTPRKFGITRIKRIKVSTRASQPLYDIGMNFGVRYAFDSGKCTGPWDCDTEFAKYGYFVGCNNVGDFPTAKWKQDNHYKDAIWYSLPGPCSNKMYSDHDSACMASNPGGACAGEPTGKGDCTYSYEEAGEITVDELEGISDYKTFISMGGREYDKRFDRGIGMSFWDGYYDESKCAARVKRAQDLFASKYGPDPPTPPCDFDFGKFYAGSGHR